MKRLRGATIATVLGLGVAAAAIAAPLWVPHGGFGFHHAAMFGVGEMGPWLDRLEQRLELRTEQQGAWRAFAEVHREAETYRQSRFQAMDAAMASGAPWRWSGAEHARFHEAMHGGDAALLGRLREARDGLLAALDPEQRQRFGVAR